VCPGASDNTLAPPEVWGIGDINPKRERGPAARTSLAPRVGLAVQLANGLKSG
jgi:hypothetical protein